MTTAVNNRIRELIAHAYRAAPAITRILDAAGVHPSDIQSADDLVRLPVTSKDDLVRMHESDPPFGGFLAVEADTLPRIYISPGPIFDPQPVNPDATEGALAAFRSVGFGRGDRVLNTFTYHLVPAGMLVDEALRLCEATVIPTGPGNTDLQIQVMRALKVSGFVGQPSYLMTILDRCEEMGLTKDDVTMKKALFSAEPYTPAQQARFEGDYGMRTTSAYATADVGFIGFTRPGVQGFCILDSLYLEIVDPKTGELVPPGEPGEIVVTSFNTSYPLIRFGTGDLGALAAQPDADCGEDCHQQLLGIYGRSGDAIKVRGMFLHPNQLNAARMVFPYIQRMQAIVTRPGNSDHVRVRVEVEAGADASDLPDQLKMLAEQAVRLRIDEVEIVPPGTIRPDERPIVDEREWE